ncbi:MAG: WYL domain-containing protein [Oscillospiraceae bacterium]|nr:WYL domain-containing protein [Oscillospiraceae bacterium]
MPKSFGQKAKILLLMDYLLHNTDESHPATMRQMTEHLESMGVSAERKSLYDDLETLREFGLDIIKTGNGRLCAYYVASRDFELPELKLLVDSVQSSKFITQRKTGELIRKLEKLASVHEAQALQRQVFVQNRIKTMNESVYYNVDAIHAGISRGKKIRFKYFDLTVDKQRSYRKNGAFYTVSPYALNWDAENYYLVAFDAEAGRIKHYRVDRMANIVTTDAPRDGQEVYSALNMAEYTKAVFGMFAGEPQRVRMRFERSLVGPVLDRLGADAILAPDGQEHFTVSADIVVSSQFFAWLFGFGTRAQILSPETVAEQYRASLRDALEAAAGAAK